MEGNIQPVCDCLCIDATWHCAWYSAWHSGTASLIAMFLSVNGYFFIPNYGTIIAAINFDRTGTTRIGKCILNHSFMIPGLVSTVSAVAIGFLLIQFLF